MKTLFVTILGLLLSVNSFAQDPFYILEDYGHLQSRAHSLIEYDSHVYVVGRALVKLDTIWEHNIHIAKYTLNGQLLKTIFFDNSVEGGDFNWATDQSISIYNKQLLITVNIGGNINEAIIRVDKDLEEAQLVSYYDIGAGPSIGIIAKSHHLTNEAKLVFPLASNLYKSLVGSYDLVKDSFQFTDYSTVSDYSYRTSKILPLANDTLLIIGGVNTIGPDNTYITGQRTTFFLKLDPKLNFVSEKLVDDRNYSGITDVFHALKKSDDEIIVMATETPRDSFGRLTDKLRPVLFSYQPSSNKILWENLLTDGIFKTRFDFNRSFIFSPDSTEYITVGNKFSDPDTGGPTIAIIQKVDSLGNNVWFKEIPDENEDSSLYLEDIISTSDGYYMACGYRFDKDDESSLTKTAI